MKSYDANIESEVELGAINDMLQAIGEPLVSTLEDNANADVVNARAILHRVSSDVQSQGWAFNIEEGVMLAPDSFSHRIPYLQDYLKLLSSDGATTYINIGGYVYDTETKTNRFEAPIKVDLIRLKSLDEMPHCIRNYIIIKAALKFNMSFFGSETVRAELKEDLAEAKVQCFKYDLDYTKPNMLTGDTYTSTLLTR